ncbi:DUF6998 domain-containing protein [Billgrantia aerodenitrificans]|uniref:DUF6998 domain-containing protein n=2 Tax=Billgrantia TaxID=3137761 RepID=A0ABS9AVP3_9GAMM|nr:hypothetical protein [Halomonas aerodenitrificans]MCE8025713.1 hypothetical protein [Halomonas aerodenitrificans]
MSDLIDAIHRLRSPRKLLQVAEAAKQRMADLGFSSGATDLVGQYAELLVQTHFGARRSANCTAGCDLVTNNGLKIEVKGRVARRDGYVPRTDIRSTTVDGHQFDYLVYVVFRRDYRIERAYGIPIHVFKKVASLVQHNNSLPKWRFRATVDLLAAPGVDDLTEDLQKILKISTLE